MKRANIWPRRSILTGVKRQTRIDARVRAGNSFGKVAEELIEKRAKEGLAEPTLDKHRWLLKLLGAEFAARPVADITPHELLHELRKQERRSRLETAKQLRSFSSRVFRYATATARADRDPAQLLLGALVAPMPGLVDYDDLTDTLTSVLETVVPYADSMADSVSALGDDLIATIGKSVNSMIVGLGGNAIGDFVEFLNMAYEPIKKGFKTGDWSDFGATVAQYGVAAAISAVMVIGSVAVATFLAGPIVAAFVAAAWAAYGLYDAVTNGVELFGKISADLADVIPKIGETIEDIGDAIEKYVGVISRVVANAMDVDFSAPIFAGSDGPNALAKKYLVDSLDPSLPGSIKGSGVDERFYGKNDAFIDAGGGDDEIYVRDSSTAFGGTGDDILAGAGARFIAAEGENPERRMFLDGGTGNDWVLALGGTGSVLVGGDGRDFIYNSSFKGQLWGDGLDGRGASNTGSGSDDTFWWSSGSFIMDAGKNDRLQLFGLPLVGGSNALYYGIGLEKSVARDFLLPWVTYGKTEGGQLLVEASFGRNLNPALGEDAILAIAQVVEGWDPGDLGIHFTVKGGDDQISLLRAAFQLLGDQLAAVKRFAKNIRWEPSDDPLVLDLNGDGLISKGLGAAYFDQDGDYFAEASGWISGDDGFLVHDADGSGTIDDVGEMFGSPGVSGFAELLGWDTNSDGIVNAEDTGFAQLKIWRDRDGDAITDVGELYSLSQLGITALSVRPTPVNITTANGTVIRAESFFAKSDGSTGKIGELIFESDRTQARYRGDRGVAGWVPSYDSVAGGTEAQRTVGAKGYGRFTDLAVAASQDLRVDIPSARISNYCDGLRAANDDEIIWQEAA